ncbi:anthranilate phosphoribosyltransferase [[Eubacterium] cellulosolvens]
MIREGIGKLIKRQDLAFVEAEEIMAEIMSGQATNAQIAAFLTALRMKGETVNEITALAKGMRQFCRQIHPKVNGTLVDTCGTGGDKIKTFNISTAAAFVASGAGAFIAKHGNRSVTSKCGSADVLEALGLNLQVSPDIVERSIKEVGIGFMFAPTFHPAMKHASGPRREIGIRTAFNILGPLTNPANARGQLLGVYSDDLTESMAQALNNLGAEHALVVYGVDGLDEISTIGRTKITTLHDGDISSTYFTPEELGVKTVNKSQIAGASPEESALILYKILSKGEFPKGEDGKAKRDIVLVNAAAALVIAGIAETIEEGVEIARESVESSRAYEKLKSLIKFSDGDLTKLEELEKHG